LISRLAGWQSPLKPGCGVWPKAMGTARFGHEPRRYGAWMVGSYPTGPSEAANARIQTHGSFGSAEEYDVGRKLSDSV